MCEIKPGPRCATDTRTCANDATCAYTEAHPDGPRVDPLAAANAQFAGGDADDARGRTHTFASWRMDEALSSIEKANKRLERAGIAERFTYEAVEDVRTIQHPDGRITYEPWTTLTLNEPAISYGGYRFLAAVDQEPGGLVTRTAPGVSLDGWRPEDMQCDQCGRKQHRGKTYIVEGEDGQRHQLGTTCVAPFLGVKPQGLWALAYDPLDDLPVGDDETDAPGGSWGRQVQPVKDTLALALALSDGGKTFMSRSRAEMYETTSTSDLIGQHLYGETRTAQDAAEHEAVAARAQAYIEDGTVDRLMEVVRSEVDSDSDWGANLHVAMDGEWVSNRQVGLLASSLTVWARQQRGEAEKATPATPGFAGPKGHKLKGSRATVTKVFHSTSYDYYKRHDVTTSFVIMRDEAGHEMTWRASSRQDLDVGQTIEFASGSVKDHGSYQGVDQTQLTRVKWAQVEDV